MLHCLCFVEFDTFEIRDWSEFVHVSFYCLQVVNSHVTGDFILIEVLPVQSVLNGTAFTIVSLDQLHKEHRRHKRDIDQDTFKFKKRHRVEKKVSVSQ